MKKVFIKYDPYEMKSTVVVDGREIQKNRHCDSNLKKYLDGSIHIPIQMIVLVGFCVSNLKIFSMNDKDIMKCCSCKIALIKLYN